MLPNVDNLSDRNLFALLFVFSLLVTSFTDYELVQVVYDHVYMLDDELKWKELPPMPKPDSHIEFAWILVNNSIVIAGGTTEKHPVTKRMVLIGELFHFNLDTLVCHFLLIYLLLPKTYLTPTKFCLSYFMFFFLGELYVLTHY